MPAAMRRIVPRRRQGRRKIRVGSCAPKDLNLPHRSRFAATEKWPGMLPVPKTGAHAQDRTRAAPFRLSRAARTRHGRIMSENAYRDVALCGCFALSTFAYTNMQPHKATSRYAF